MNNPETTRLLLLLESEYLHHPLNTHRHALWQIILSDVPFPLACEAVQDWVDGDANRTRFPHPGQLRESALRLLPNSSCWNREWAPFRVGSFYFRARLEDSRGPVLWAAYGLTVPQIAVHGTAPNLQIGLDLLRASLGAELRRLDSVRVPLNIREIRAMAREAVAS